MLIYSVLLKWRLVKQAVAWIELHLEYVLSETRTKGSDHKEEVNIFAEYTGLYGFIAKSGYQAVFPGVNQGKQVFYQGSRQMDNFSRRYYERELGAGIAPSPSMREHVGYTEPFRRFVQREDFSPQTNEIPNNMPFWLPDQVSPSCLTQNYLTRARQAEASPMIRGAPPAGSLVFSMRAGSPSCLTPKNLTRAQETEYRSQSAWLCLVVGCWLLPAGWFWSLFQVAGWA